MAGTLKNAAQPIEANKIIMARRIVKQLSLRFNDTPFTFVPRSSLEELGIRDDQRELLDEVLGALERYSEHRYQLTKTTYQHLLSALPAYFLERRMISVVCCPDGVIVRYERQNFEGVVGSWSDNSIRDITSLVSENSVYLIDEGGHLPDDFKGPSVTLFSQGSDGSKQERLSFQLVVVGRVSGEDTVQRPNGPLRIVHATATFEFGMVGVELDEGQKWKRPDSGLLFVTRTPIPLSVAWDEFEVYGAK